MVNKIKNRINNKSIVRRVILDLLKKGAIATFDLAAIFLETKYKGFRLIEKGAIRRAVYELIKDDELVDSGNQRYRFTNLGIVRALPEINKVLKNDGKLRILVFDIPEEKRILRDRFRRQIKELGFKKHQQSVWISRYDCENWMLKVIEYHKVGAYVSLYIGEHIW